MKATAAKIYPKTRGTIGKIEVVGAGDDDGDSIVEAFIPNQIGARRQRGGDD